MGGIGKYDPKRGNSQLLVALGSFYIDLRVDFASRDQLLEGWKRAGGEHHSICLLLRPVSFLGWW